MIRYSIAIVSGLLLIPCLVNADDQPASAPAADPRLSGGATTVFDTSRNAFSLPARNLSLLRREDFFTGNAFFKLPWVIAPASTTARDGLGPFFNTNGCQGCHVRDGRGQPPISKDDRFLSTLIRLSIPPSTAEHQQTVLKRGAVPEPNYGDQLQPKAIPGVKTEAVPRLSYREVTGQFNDGEQYTLLKPELSFDDLNYGELHPQLQTSVRVAPVMVGLGLLEAITESDILRHADPKDKDGDGISGRANRVWDVRQQKTVLGRFGWKANHPDVQQQSEAAFSSDLGITTPLFPEQSCTEAQTLCQRARHGGEPEISAKIMQRVVYFAKTLGVPARRNVHDPVVLQGEKLFNKVGCNTCHVSEYVTGESAGFPELSGQRIRPYTDLLLHDMGKGLADERPDFQASGREWRTPPLWGIGLVEAVNGHTRFLHDGRARNLLEAVLWHGGEAEASQQQVLAMNGAERQALIAFLNSL